MSPVIPASFLAGIRLASNNGTVVAAAYAATLAGAFVPTAAAVRELLASTGHGFTPASGPRGLDGALALDLVGDLHLEQWIGLALFMMVWTGVTGGALAHFARDDGSRASLGMLAGDGVRLLPPLLILSAISAAAAAALGFAHAGTEGILLTRLDHWEGERTAAAARAALGIAFLGAIAVGSSVMRFARVELVAGPDRGIARGIVAGLGILRRHPAAVLGLQATGWGSGLFLIAAFSWIPLEAPVEAGLGRVIVVLAMSQVAVFLHAGLRIAVIAAELTLWRRFRVGLAAA